MTQDRTGSGGALADLLHGAWSRMGERVSIRDGGADWSGRRLLERAGVIRRGLCDLGIAPNEPVLVFVSNTAADFAALLGVWEAGGVVVPVHRNSPAGAVAGLQEDTGSRFQVDGDLTAWPGVAGQQPCDERPGVRRLNPVFSASDPILEGAALVVFTSGSTGRPKGVVLSHAAMARKLENNQSVFGFDGRDRTLLVLQITFSFGLWVSLLALTREAVLVVKQRVLLADVLDTAAAEAITRTGMVPTTLRALVAETGRPGPVAAALGRVVGCGRLRHIFTGGESYPAPLADAVRRLLPGAFVTNIFGLSETCTCDFMLGPADAQRHPGCVGRAAPDVSYRLVDDGGQVIEDAGIGELQIATPTIMNGYLHQPELTGSSFSDGFFRTGDLVRRHADGVLEVVGRLKEVISRGGNKVYPQEVEQALLSHPAVAHALVTGVPDELMGERIHAAVVMIAGQQADPGALRDWAARRLDRFKLPDVIHPVAELPVGRTGKSDRGRLRERLMSGA